MSQPHQDPENPTQEAKATPLPSYESTLRLHSDTISLKLAPLDSIDRLLILLICLCILWLLFSNCFSVLYIFMSLD